MALNSLFCADVPLSNYCTHSLLGNNLFYALCNMYRQLQQVDQKLSHGWKFIDN